MSSTVSSGKSRRTSSTLIPPARYSSTSRTVIRMPRIQGWPPRLPGSTVMNCSKSIALAYSAGSETIKGSSITSSIAHRCSVRPPRRETELEGLDLEWAQVKLQRVFVGHQFAVGVLHQVCFPGRHDLRPKRNLHGRGWLASGFVNPQDGGALSAGFQGGDHDVGV